MALWLTARQFVALCALLLLACTTLTVLRNLDYRSELALWQATVALSPDKPRVHNNLGYAYELAGQHAAARWHYLKALALDRQNFKSSYNLKALDASQR
jgi:Flp pilus assembly protein TadD